MEKYLAEHREPHEIRKQVRSAHSPRRKRSSRTAHRWCQTHAAASRMACRTSMHTWYVAPASRPHRSHLHLARAERRGQKHRRVPRCGAGARHRQERRVGKHDTVHSPSTARRAPRSTRLVRAVWRRRRPLSHHGAPFDAGLFPGHQHHAGAHTELFEVRIMHTNIACSSKSTATP